MVANPGQERSAAAVDGDARDAAGHASLQEGLARLASAGLRRILPPGRGDSGRSSFAGDWIELSSNDYLGLSGASELVEAATAAARMFGTGARASRLICGNVAVHEALEAALAEWKGTEAALVFSSGYAANVGVLTALAGPRDAIFSDALNHASLIDAGRQSHALFVQYRHRDLEHLEALLTTRAVRGQRVIVSDTVFSMDGTVADLQGLLELAERFDAWLVVDDAHGTGVAGSDGSGCWKHAGLGARERVVQIGTMSKALGSQGGFAVGTRVVIDWLINKARSFVFSTGLSPMLAGAGLAAVGMARARADLRAIQQGHTARLREALAGQGWKVLGESPAPMLGVVLGEPIAAVEAGLWLGELGVGVGAVRPPTVPVGTSRLRLAPTGLQTQAEMQRVLEAFERLRAVRGLGVAPRPEAEREKS